MPKLKDTKAYIAKPVTIIMIDSTIGFNVNGLSDEAYRFLLVEGLRACWDNMTGVPINIANELEAMKVLNSLISST